VPRRDSEEGDASGGGKGGGGSSEARAHAFGEEERRLAYVALSRPQTTLVVSYVLQVDVVFSLFLCLGVCAQWNGSRSTVNIRRLLLIF